MVANYTFCGKCVVFKIRILMADWLMCPVAVESQKYKTWAPNKTSKETKETKESLFAPHFIIL